MAVLGFALSPVLVLDLVLQTPARHSPAAPTTALHKQKVNVALPVRLEIPKINVDTAIDYVNLTSQGDLAVPAGPANVGWYHQGPRPGEVGNAVMDGHFGYRDRIPAVFDNLHTLQKGDKLYVKDQKGLTTTFVVRELQTYKPDDYAAAVFRSSDGQAHLNLITCQGKWNQTEKSYSDRLVVFTDKII